MAYTPTIGLGGMSNYSNPLLQQDRLLNTANPEQYDPNAYIDPRQIAMQSMAMQQQLAASMWQRQNPIESAPGNLGNFLSQAVQKAGSFGAYDPANAPASAPQGAQQQNPQEQAIFQAVQAHKATLLSQDPTMDIGKAQYLASAAVMMDPAYQDPTSQQMLGRYASEAVSKFGYSPKEQKDGDLTRQAQSLQIQKSQADLLKTKLAMQFGVVDQQTGADGVPVNKPMSGAITMYNMDGSDRDPGAFQSDVEKAIAQAKANGAKSPTLMPMDKILADQSAAKEQGLKDQEMKAQTDASRAQAAAMGAPGSNPDNDKAIVSGLVDGSVDPNSLSTRNNARGYYIAQAKQQAPWYNEQNYGVTTKILKDYSPGGVVGQNLVSAGTAISHTQSVMQAVKDLGNSDPNVAQAAMNKMKTEFHLSTAPQTVQTMMVPYATEVLKSISKNGGTEDERAALTAAINAPAGSTQGALDALTHLQGMFLDRVQNYKQQFKDQTGGRTDFNSRYAGGMGSPMEQALRQHERSNYNGQNIVSNPNDYAMIPVGSPYTNKISGDPAYNKIGIKGN